MSDYEEEEEINNFDIYFYAGFYGCFGIMMFVVILSTCLCYLKIEKENAKLPKEQQVFNSTKRFTFFCVCFCCSPLCALFLGHQYLSEIKFNQKIKQNSNDHQPIQTAEVVIQVTSTSFEEIK